MEKPAGVGWDANGPSQFEQFLCGLSDKPWITPVTVSGWASTARIADAVKIEGGTYLELARQFGAGELYENWFFDPRWAPYREYFTWSSKRVDHLTSLRADSRLIELAHKHLLASTWETAWHTPAEGAHGAIGSDGAPSGSARAVASHSRHAAMIAEAAYWQVHKDGESHCYLQDLDNDGEDELIFKNQAIFAVLSPKHGGRLIALFSVHGVDGKMVIGNPCDDWNLKEELNDYMDTPPNHPGALADVGFEHDAYHVQIMVADGGRVCARLHNEQKGSLAFGLVKELNLSSFEDDSIHVEYSLPDTLRAINVEFGLSPDYLELLRKGRTILMPYDRDQARGWSTENIAVWVKPVNCGAHRWTVPYQREFGHGCAVRLSVEGSQFGLVIGVERISQMKRMQETLSLLVDECV